MSDRRVKYIVLASIIFVGIVGISQGQGLFELNDVNPIMPNTSLGYLGHVTAVVKDSNGNIKAYLQADNIVVDIGRDCASALVFDSGLGADCSIVEFMAIGSSTVSAVRTNPDLFDKTDNGNLLIASTEIVMTMTGIGGNDATIDYEKTFIILASDSGERIGETGMFDAANNMFNRAVFLPSFGVTEGDEVTVGWELTVD